MAAPERDYLEILGNPIEEYERVAYPTEPLRPREMLKASMEAKGVTQTEVSKATGITNSTISDLLARKREFNVAQIGRLCAYFGLGPSAFYSRRETRTNGWLNGPAGHFSSDKDKCWVADIPGLEFCSADGERMGRRLMKRFAKFR